MPWNQISVISDQQHAPGISDYFSELGAVSVTYMDAEDQPVYEPPPGVTQIWSQTKIIALFETDSDADLLKLMMFAKFNDDCLQNWHAEVLQDQVWERTWLEHFKPVKFGDTLWVCPSGQEVSETGSVCMTLDPGLAFGTGTHPTTALCLETLAGLDLKHQTVIDYGCGSGILAVAAVLLGAELAHCVDIDPQALEATQSNAKKNAVEKACHCYLPDDFKNNTAEVVVANILAQPLIELAETISGLLKPDGHLILSGILTEQADSVLQAYQQQGLTFSQPVIKDDWCCLYGVKQ